MRDCKPRARITSSEARHQVGSLCHRNAEIRRLNRQSDEELVREAERIRDELLQNRDMMDKQDIGRMIRRDEEFRQKKLKERADKMASKSYYAVIGSRKTPDDVLVLMEQLGNRLRLDGMILRSGHAPGADQAFESGAGAQAQIFLPWRTFEQDAAFTSSHDHEDGTITEPDIFDEPTAEAYSAAANLHPAWGQLSGGARALHARNVHQIIGPDLARPTPVDFVICWTPKAATVGGTATAMLLARERKILIHNLADEETYDMAFEWAWGED